MKDKTDPKETRHQHFQLYWKDVLVEGGHLSLHSRQGRLMSAHARIIEDLAVDVGKPIAESQALGKALADRKLTLSDLNEKLPKGQLVLTSLDDEHVKESYRLAYAFDIDNMGAQRTDKAFAKPYRIWVDAVSGEVVKRVSLSDNWLSNVPATPAGKGPIRPFDAATAPATSSRPMFAATFNSLYPRGNPTPSFEVEQTGQGSETRLTMSTPNPNGDRALETRWDLNNNFAWDDADITNPNTNWGNNRQQATLAHWTTWRTYEYFRSQFGVNGTDGQGSIARILISPNLEGATWNIDDRIMRIGTVNGAFLSTVDIVGHEYGHGITHHLVAGWQRTNSEPGSLNEGFSDIIGSFMERQLVPDGGPNDSWYWQMGENAAYARNMASPHDFGQPQTYHEPGFWQFNPGFPHHNNGVLNKWFHTLCTGNGPNGTNITPISIQDAMRIVYWALDFQIYGDFGYVNAAGALKRAAVALFGGCSPQEKAVGDAWTTAGIPLSGCNPDCNYQPVNTSPLSANCNQVITLSAGCAGAPGNTNVWTCQSGLYSFTGPNVPYNSSTNSSFNVTTPATPGNYQYEVSLDKTGCFRPRRSFTINVSCAQPPLCDFSGGPRYVGSWNGLTVQIRAISGKNVLVTAINGTPDKYYPRGDNFWGSFSPDPNAANLQSCLNAGSTGFGGLGFPGGLTPPSGYSQGQEADGAVFFVAGGGQPPVNPCDMSTPRAVGTWNGLNVQIRQFPNNKRALVTAVPGAANDKYYVRGDNFWDNFTKNADAEQYRVCLNTGDTPWYGLAFPGGISTPPGYQQGSESDGAIFFSTNGQRMGAPTNDATVEQVALVKVRPNPVRDELTVTFILSEAGSVPVRLLNVQGRAVQQQTYQGVAGPNERLLNVASLPVGVYMLEVRLGTQRIVQKIVKE